MTTEENIEDLFADWRDGFELTENQLEILATNIKVGINDCTEDERLNIIKEATELGLI